MRVGDEKPRAMRDRMTVQPMGGETLVYDDRRHMAFCLNASAGAVWRLADGVRSVAEISRAAGAEMGAGFDEEIVRLALDELRECGLVEAKENEAAASVSRRALLARISATALLPVVASIVAPTAAQAYSGCVDCSVARPLRRGGRPAAPPGDPGP